MPDIARNRFNLAAGLRCEAERAKELGISRAMLRRARQNGDLSFIRIGDRPFYSIQHIETWLRRNEYVSEFPIDAPERKS